MELDLSSDEDYFLKKHLFNLKTHRIDGLILQVHHSYSDSAGENKRFWFIHASFNYHGTHLAVSDHKGNTFIIDLELERYWQLPQLGLPTVISFPILKKQELLIGLDSTTILFIHIETGKIIAVLRGHSVPATEVSYSDDGYYYLTSCSDEAIIWDSSTFIQIHRLSLKQEVYLKKVLFMPVTNHILACFQDNTIHVWKFGSFECIKRIVPETWKSHQLHAIAITKNGREMVVGGQCSKVVVFCLDIWDIKNIIEFPDNISGVKQLEFLSEVFDRGANKILVVLTTSQELFFFDIETLVFLKWMHQINGLTAKFFLNCYDGKYLATILGTGEVNVYLVERVLGYQKFTSGSDDGCNLMQRSTSRLCSSSSKRTQKSSESLISIQKEIKEILDLKKLLPILKQFGEYPQSYRALIWKTILQLPENEECFVSLSLKKCHQSYSKIEIKYPLANKTLCNALKKLLSNLAHWCPLFGEVNFLPEFVFPFVKLFHSNPLDCFEVVATVIVNWCQNWFEFYPFPPINMLSVLESILGHHDPDLLEFYMMNNITSSIFICPLYHTAFSEVLSKAEWLKLWDHILSNETSFFFMAIIAYNVVCQSAVRNLHNPGEIEKFFHTQNPIDMKMLIGKAYNYLKGTPEDIHTRQFFTPFRSIGSGGTYNTFIAYPKLIFDAGTEKLQSLRKEEDKILEEQFKALSIKKALEEKLTEGNTVEEKEKIYQELEEKLRNTVEEEEDRLLVERQKLQNLRQELKLKELEVLENTRDKALKKKIQQKETEFQRLQKDISKRKTREKAEIRTIENEIRNYYSDLLLRKCQLELELGLNHDESDPARNLKTLKEQIRDDLTELQYEWDNSCHSKRIDLCNKITAIKGLICDVEAEIAKEMAENNSEKLLREDRVFVEELRRKVTFLEEEIEKLLEKNLENLRNKKEKKSLSPRFSTKSRKPEEKEKKQEPRNSGNKKAVKYVTRKTSPGSRLNIRRMTTIRNRAPKAKAKESKNESTEFLPKDLDSFINTTASELTSTKPRSPHQRSKFTHPCSPDSPHSVVRDESNNFENYFLTCHQKGDDTEVITQTKQMKKKCKSTPGFKMKKDDPLSCDADEIFKSALRTRNHIIEEAKRRQKFQ